MICKMTNYQDIMTRTIERFMFEPWDHVTQSQIEREFKINCPGPYKIIWFEELDVDFIPKYQLSFDNPMESTIWYLKWT